MQFTVVSLEVMELEERGFLVGLEMCPPIKACRILDELQGVVALGLGIVAVEQQHH